MRSCGTSWPCLRATGDAKLEYDAALLARDGGLAQRVALAPTKRKHHRALNRLEQGSKSAETTNTACSDVDSDGDDDAACDASELP